jgi:ABC-type multidrug transport system ATPase subunit
MIKEVSTMTDYSLGIENMNIENLNKKLAKKNLAAKRGAYGLLEPFQVTWKELTYRVPGKLFQPKKIILNNVSGYFKSGQITAVMGPSGSGKSSLLGCISGQKKTGLSGSITISTGSKVRNRFLRLSNK